MVVSPRAAKPARTSEALAHKSLAITCAPDSGVGPATMAWRPSMRMFAPMRARALDLGAHGCQQSREIGDFRLAGGVLDHGFAAGQHRGHQKVFGAGYGDAIELNMGAVQALRCFRVDVTVIVPDLGSQSFESR